jgi:hypothetical protein
MDTTSLPDQPRGPYPRPPRGHYLGFDQRTSMLHTALHGIKLGAFDRRTIDWLCHWCDTPTFLVVLGLVERARHAGPQSQAQVEGSRPC